MAAARAVVPPVLRYYTALFVPSSANLNTSSPGHFLQQNVILIDCDQPAFPGNELPDLCNNGFAACILNNGPARDGSVAVNTPINFNLRLVTGACAGWGFLLKLYCHLYRAKQIRQRIVGSTEVLAVSPREPMLQMGQVPPHSENAPMAIHVKLTACQGRYTTNAHHNKENAHFGGLSMRSGVGP